MRRPFGPREMVADRGAIGGVLPRSGIETSASKALTANGLFSFGANKSLMGEGVRG